jgi:ABC-type transport system substrate-binding protein
MAGSSKEGVEGMRRWSRRLSAVLIMVGVLVVAPSAGGSGGKPRCLGKIATIVGTAGDDVIVGGGQNDVVVALGGNDRIEGLDGRDVMCGGEGDDVLVGGAGPDAIDGGPGTDTASFADSPAAVSVDLGAGTATGLGSDTLVGVENVDGSPGDDDLFGDAADNVLSGGAGSDLLQSFAGADRSSGGAGADILRGGEGTDLLDGGAEEDECVEGETLAGCDRVGPGALKIDSPFDFDSVDPALSFLSHSVQLQSLTCARLVTYPDASAPGGSELVPDAAASMPHVSSRGRKYTFRIRPGLAFSPPSTETVTAATFKATIERALNPAMQSPASLFLDDLVGLAEFRAGTATGISGIAAKGDELTITIERPRGDFLARLAKSQFCAVPVGTPVDPAGAPPLPSAGPYYLASWDRGVGAVALRNRNYRGRRSSTFDRIEWTVVSLVNTRARIEAGIADTGVILPFEAAELRALYGPGSPAAAAGRQRYFTFPLPVFWHLALNTERAFRDTRLRRAVGYALDRRHMASLHGFDAGEATDQYLTSGVPGYVDHDLFPLAGDLATARALAAAAGVTPATPIAVRFYTFTGSFGPAVAAYMADALAPLGIEVEVLALSRAVQDERMATRGEPFDIGLTGWAADYLDPFNVLDVLLNGSRLQPTGNRNQSYFDDRAFNERLDEAARLEGADRYAAYSGLDRDLASAAPLVSYIQTWSRQFFSDRIGCHAFQPASSSVPLNVLCVR